MGATSIDATSGTEVPENFRPLVSVLLLTWNHEQFIRSCVHSILGQNYDNVELICCENGSSDGTWTALTQSVAEFPDRRTTLYQNPPGTPVNVGFNGLIERANGELLCFFSGDDLFCEGRIAAQVEAFAGNRKLEITYSNGRFLGGHRNGGLVHDDRRCIEMFDKGPEDVLRYVFSNRGLMIQTFMARSDLIRAIGGFDEKLLADDWILNIRLFGHLQHREQYSYLPFVSFEYRQHENNSYKNFPRQSKLMIDVIKNYYKFPDYDVELARMYYFQASVGANYGRAHLRLTSGYLYNALRMKFMPKYIIIFLLRFVLQWPLAIYRKLRDVRAADRFSKRA